MNCLWCSKPTEGETFFYCCYEHKLYHRLYSAEWEYSFEDKEYPDFMSQPFITKEKKDG